VRSAPSMTPLETDFVEIVTVGITLGLLAFGLFILVFLRPRGGPEVAFARLLADSRRRTVFLAALCTSLVALFSLTVAESVEAFLDTSAATSSVVRTALLAVGAVGIFVLMTDALNTRPFTLEEEWNLRETAARVSNPPAGVPQGADLEALTHPNDTEAPAGKRPTWIERRNPRRKS
jgi:hypothetical protein